MKISQVSQKQTQRNFFLNCNIHNFAAIYLFWFHKKCSLYGKLVALNMLCHNHMFMIDLRTIINLARYTIIIC